MLKQKPSSIVISPIQQPGTNEGHVSILFDNENIGKTKYFIFMFNTIHV